MFGDHKIIKLGLFQTHYIFTAVLLNKDACFYILTVDLMPVKGQLLTLL